MEAEQKFLSLSEAAALTPYSSSYLSFLARQGKLRCVKNGDAWATTRAWLLDYMNSVAQNPRKRSAKSAGPDKNPAPRGYISSAQAERLFPYSSSYVSLRMRQGKLKGEKINGKWLTKPEWVQAYMDEFAEKTPESAVPRPSFNIFSIFHPATVVFCLFTLALILAPNRLWAGLV